jgi:hypothetical protein
MEIKVENNEFWILDNKKAEEKTIFNELDDSIKHIKKTMKKDFNPEDLELLHVLLEDESMKFQGVSWKEIAMRLMKLD